MYLHFDTLLLAPTTCLFQKEWLPPDTLPKSLSNEFSPSLFMLVSSKVKKFISNSLITLLISLFLYSFPQPLHSRILKLRWYQRQTFCPVHQPCKFLRSYYYFNSFKFQMYFPLIMLRQWREWDTKKKNPDILTILRQMHTLHAANTLLIISYRILTFDFSSNS